MVRGFRDEDRSRHRDDDRDPVEIADATAERETKLALLCVFKQGKKIVEKWIPKSQITEDSEVWEPGQSGKLIITGWLAEREGIE